LEPCRIGNISPAGASKAPNTHKRPLLIFDQFEELITHFEESVRGDKLRASREAQEAIITTIVELIQDETLPIKVLFVFREDYLAKLNKVFAHTPDLTDQFVRLVPPDAGALGEIIRKPLERFPGVFGGHFTSELIDEVAKDIARKNEGTPISLSEVEIACLRLWQSKDPQTLFEQSKGVQGLLEGYLSESLGQFQEQLRMPAVAILSRLLTSSSPPTRKIVSEEEVIADVHAEEGIDPEQGKKALAKLVDAKLVQRELRRQLYYCEIVSEFLVPWILEKRQAREASEQAREASELRHRLTTAAKQRTAAWIVAGVCLALAVFCALEWWRYTQEKHQNLRLTQKNGDLIQKNSDLQGEIDEKQGALKDTEAKLSSLNTQVQKRDAKVADLDSEIKRSGDRLAQAESNAEDILRKTEERLNEANEINALLLQDPRTWQDPRARMQPFSNLDNDILQIALSSIKIIAATGTENESGVGRAAALMAESNAILSVLAGDIGRAITECSTLLERLRTSPKTLNLSISELLKVRGELLAKRRFFARTTADKDNVNRLEKEDWEHAVQDLDEARNLASRENMPVFEARVLLSLSDIERQLSYIPDQQQHQEEARKKAHEFAEQAKKQLEQALANSSIKPETSAGACFLLEDAYRKLGNIELDFAVASNGARKAKESAERAELFYLTSLKQSELGEKFWGSNRITAAFLTAKVGKAFSQANLADIYELLLRSPLLSGSERVAYHQKCLAALNDRIATCRELVTLQTPNRYFWTLLAQGYRNRGDYYLNYKGDESKEEVKQRVFEDMRIAYLITFPYTNEALQTDYEKAVGSRFGPNAKNQVATLNKAALKEILPLVQKEQNDVGPSPVGKSSD
jgi:hypothetical protein